MTTFYPEPTRSDGGHLCLMHGVKLDLSPLVMIMLIGVPSDESRTKEEARERADRTRRTGAVSSWVTRDPGNRRLGGGVALDLGDAYAAFAGPPEDTCEAIVLVAAVMCDLLYGLPFVSDKRVKEIVSVSDNQKFIPLLALCQRELTA
jgi:hypothetical protein